MKTKEGNLLCIQQQKVLFEKNPQAGLHLNMQENYQTQDLIRKQVTHRSPASSHGSIDSRNEKFGKRHSAVYHHHEDGHVIMKEDISENGGFLGCPFLLEVVVKISLLLSGITTFVLGDYSLKWWRGMPLHLWKKLL